MFIILLQFFLLTGFWCIDIGLSGMMWEQAYGPAQAQGLGFVRSPNIQYHLGLLLVYLVFIIQTAWLLYVIKCMCFGYP